MRDRAGKGEQRTVAAEKGQSVGQRDKGLLQDIVGFIGGAAERARNKAPDARAVAIEEFVRRIFVASLETRDQIGFRRLRRGVARSCAEFSARTSDTAFSVDKCAPTDTGLYQFGG